VDVAAYLPRQLLNHLKIVLGSEHSLAVATNWADLRTTVQLVVADLVVADPAASGTIDPDSLEQLRRDYPSLPVVLYTRLNPSSMKAVVRLAKAGIEHVVIAHFDDEPGQFRELLEGIPAHALGERMLRELAGPLSALPVVVVRGPVGAQPLVTLRPSAGRVPTRHRVVRGIQQLGEAAHHPQTLHV